MEERSYIRQYRTNHFLDEIHLSLGPDKLNKLKFKLEEELEKALAFGEDEIISA